MVSTQPPLLWYLSEDLFVLRHVLIKQTREISDLREGQTRCAIEIKYFSREYERRDDTYF